MFFTRARMLRYCNEWKGKSHQSKAEEVMRFGSIFVALALV